jgi:uncharacterized phiE125 gp8 family phage protein
MAVYNYVPYPYPGWYLTWCDYGRTPAHVRSAMTVPPPEEPLTLEQAKLRANLTWQSGGTPPDPRDELMQSFIRAARAKVEHDTGLALITQTREIYLDAVSGSVITLPWLSLPLQEVVSIVTIDAAGNPHTMDPATYIVDYLGGRIALVSGAAWPTDLRTFQPWTITIVAGYENAADLAEKAPPLLQAVGLLTAHYATLGRDLASIQTATEIPQGYGEILEAYLPITVV